MIRIGRIAGKFIVNPTMDEVMLNIKSYLSFFCAYRFYVSKSFCFLTDCGHLIVTYCV